MFNLIIKPGEAKTVSTSTIWRVDPAGQTQANTDPRFNKIINKDIGEVKQGELLCVKQQGRYATGKIGSLLHQNIKNK